MAQIKLGRGVIIGLCPKRCGGSFYLDKDQFGWRAVCTLCSYQKEFIHSEGKSTNNRNIL